MANGFASLKDKRHSSGVRANAVQGTTHADKLLDVFFSSSFHDEDEAVVRFFRAICEGMSLRCIVLGDASADDPLTRAKDAIRRASALVAIGTRRSKLHGTDGDYLMPEAVNQEISTAVAHDKPVLVFLEGGVSFRGFNIATHKYFLRESLLAGESETLRSIVDSAHSLRGFLDAAPSLDPAGFEAEDVVVSIALERAADGAFAWTASTRKSLTYLDACSTPLIASWWAELDVVVPPGEPPLDVKVEVDASRSTRAFELKATFRDHTPIAADVTLTPVPTPRKGDRLTYAVRYRSKYLVPIYLDQIVRRNPMHVGPNEYQCYDGVIAVQGTKSLTINYVFPEEYGLKRHDVDYFVSGYSGRPDHHSLSERARMDVDINSVGDVVLWIKICVDRPRVGLFYAVAWNPPPAPLALDGTPARGGRKSSVRKPRGG